MKNLKILTDAQLENVSGGTYWEGLKGVNKGIFWADRPDKSVGYFENKGRRIKEGWDKCGSTAAKAGVVATDATIAGVVAGGIALVATGSIGATVWACVRRAKNKAKSLVS